MPAETFSLLYSEGEDFQLTVVDWPGDMAMLRVTESVTLYLHHHQLVQFRDALTAAIAASPAKCYCCEDAGERTCECGKFFCEQHGSRGRDRENVSIPNCCDGCLRATERWLSSAQSA